MQCLMAECRISRGDTAKMKLIFVSLLWILSLSGKAECQFLYPVDENPPNNPLTFQCYTCSSEFNSSCADIQDRSNPSQECNGIRIGCWVTLDVESGNYERTCVQPQSIRQGVYCNRHMEGREFCYYEETESGLRRRCSKCCLNNYCNGDQLAGEPDSFFRTCIECNGRDEPECNRDGMEAFGLHLQEQCLMPNSDCWVAKVVENGETLYTRGCQIAECDDENVDEICSREENRVTCTKCCPEDEKCNYGLLTGDASKIFHNKVVTTLAVFIVFFAK